MIHLVCENRIVSHATSAIMTRLTTRRLEEINKLQTAARTAANQNVAGGGMNAGSLNVMFQAQDIAMMAASGQNVMVTALQQGTQLAGGLQQVQQAGQSMTQTLLGGFAALLNPLSLVTTAPSPCRRRHQIGSAYV